jgi:hypothetical protein
MTHYTKRCERKNGPPVDDPWTLSVNTLGKDPLLAALREHHSLADIKEIGG